jgi:hypothetical protein
MFCIILPMYQFAYFVGKMTHRPEVRRNENETASAVEPQMSSNKRHAPGGA